MRTIDEMLHEGLTLYEMKEELRLEIVRKAIRMGRGRQCRAADRLGIHRNIVSRTLQAYGLTKKRSLSAMGHASLERMA